MLRAGQKEIDMHIDNRNDSNVAWFCLRSQLKHEHIAAAHLRRYHQVDVFVPLIRFKRATRYGTVWVTEALFPSYFFARFDWTSSLRLVHYSPGVYEIVHFGCYWPVVPDQAVEELRSVCGKDDIHVIESELKPGDRVRIAGGSFHGLQAVVSYVMPSRQRVAVLLDFLGSQSQVEIDLGKVIKESEGRRPGVPCNKAGPSTKKQSFGA